LKNFRARNGKRNNFESIGEKRLQLEVLDVLPNCSNNPIIIDVGTYIGVWTLSLIKQSQIISGINKLNIHVFDPFTSTFYIVSERLQKCNEKVSSQCDSCIAITC